MQPRHIRPCYNVIACSHGLGRGTLQPVALWPNNTYDTNGCWSGSATVTPDGPVISYTCVGSTELQCLAYPSNVSDPLLVSWYKDAANPVIPEPPAGGGSDFRDDTTAWWDEASNGWLMAVGARIDSDLASIALYSSPDFATWNFSNFLWQRPGYGMFECPDFFPLPGVPDLYVAKYSDNGDWATVGTYDAANRTFTPMGPTVMYDYGQWYASKSFYDAPNDRQVLWGWVAEEDSATDRVWMSTNSIPRVITYDADLQTVNVAPLPDLVGLRNATLAQGYDVSLPPNSWQVLEGADSVQQEVEAVFAVPQSAVPAEFGLAVLASSSGTTQTRYGIVYAPATGPLNNTDLPGGDYQDIPLNPNATDVENAANCSALCAAQQPCVAWTSTRLGFPSPPPYNYSPRCSLKSNIPNQNPSAPCCISGVRGGWQLAVNRTNAGGDGNLGGRQASFVVKEGEDTITLRVFVDHSIVEGFVQGGRVAITSRVYPTDPDALHVAAYAVGGGATLLEYTSWSLANTAVSVSEVSSRIAAKSASSPGVMAAAGGAVASA
jgi:sucrose-6-phosphate hydrolase SacC (GH32 family)